jgi:hypothetical protein
MTAQITAATPAPQISAATPAPQITAATPAPQIARATEAPQIDGATEAPRITAATPATPIAPATPGSPTTDPQTTAPVDRDADARLADQIRIHHSAMVADLDRLTADLRDADAAGDDERAARARLALESWFADVLVPHADEEESTTYRAAAALPEGRWLIDSMVREHQLIKRLVALFHASPVTAAAAFGRAVFEAFDSHQRKENEVILPLLVDSPAVSLVEVMGAAHGHQLDAHENPHGHAHHDHQHGHGHEHHQDSAPVH